MSIAIMNARRAWSVLKQLEQEYVAWNDEQKKYKRRIRKTPLKEGHFHILNHYEIDRSLIDYRIFGEKDEFGDINYSWNSCILNYFRDGFNSIESAYIDVKKTISSIYDGGGFCLTILREDSNTVHGFKSEIPRDLPWISSLWYDTTNDLDKKFPIEEEYDIEISEEDKCR